jgi:hypothetical protein
MQCILIIKQKFQFLKKFRTVTVGYEIQIKVILIDADWLLKRLCDCTYYVSPWMLYIWWYSPNQSEYKPPVGFSIYPGNAGLFLIRFSITLLPIQ